MKTLLDIIGENNIQISNSGERKVAVCPFHKGDNTPSFTIYPNDTYFCFGCEAWGDAVKFLVDFKHMSFDDAVTYVGADYKLRNADKPQVIKVKNALHTYEFLSDVADQYHRFLMQTPGALNYLTNRGLTTDTIVRYKLGYTDGRVLRLNWAWEQEMALEAGLINKNGFELLSHRIIIPNLTEEKQCDFMVGRTVTADRIRYLGIRVPKPIHGFYEVRHSPVLFIAEGQFDWLTLRQWGYPAAVIGGTHLSRSNHNLLRDKRIVIIPDLDESGVGMDAAIKIQAQLGEERATILDYSELKTSPGKLDISELAQSPGAKALFDTIVMEQLPWIAFLSNRIRAKWFPTLQTTTYSHLTQKQLA